MQWSLVTSRKSLNNDGVIFLQAEFFCVSIKVAVFMLHSTVNFGFTMHNFHLYYLPQSQGAYCTRRLISLPVS